MCVDLSPIEDRSFLTEFLAIVREQIGHNWNQLNSYIRTLHVIMTVAMLAMPFLQLRDQPTLSAFTPVLFLVVGTLLLLGLAPMFTFRRTLLQLYRTIIKIETLLGVFEEYPQIAEKLPQAFRDTLKEGEAFYLLPRQWQERPQTLHFGWNPWTLNTVFVICVGLLCLSFAVWLIVIPTAG